MTDRLKNKVAFITGGAQGLGKEMAKSMIKEGARVIISDINEETLEETAKELSCDHIVLDVTNKDQWQMVVTKIKDDIGSLNILVNNAGMGGGGDVESTDIELWDLLPLHS